jgi:hypothetical protein
MQWWQWGMQLWQWTRYQLMLSVDAAAGVQRGQLRHSSLCWFEAGVSEVGRFLLSSILSPPTVISAELYISQPAEVAL